MRVTIGSASMSEKTYTVGGTINPSVGFYLTREADTKLLEACRNGAFAYILAPRQSGKSSLMVHTALELQQEGVHYAIIDLTRIGTELDVEQWYFGLLMEVVEQLELELDLADWWEQR